MPKQVSIKKQSRKGNLSRNVRKLRSKIKSKSKSKSKSQQKIKSQKKSRKQKGGSECEYLKVEGINLPGLVIPEQYAFIDSNCQGSSNAVPSATSHPNIST